MEKLNHHEIIILNVLGAHRNFMPSPNIARFSRLPLPLTTQILDKFEKERITIV